MIVSSPRGLSAVFLLHDDDTPHEAPEYDKALQHTIYDLQMGLPVGILSCLCPLNYGKLILTKAEVAIEVAIML